MPSRYCEKHSTGSAAIKATVAYTSNGAFVNQATDQDGKVITYAYNQNTGTLTSATDSSGTVTYSYQADNNLLTGVSKQLEDKGYTVSNSYTYTTGTNRNLTKITHNGTEYNIEYDAYNNKTASKVGSKLLARNSYGANNGLLSSVTYGTGRYVTYAYDAFGNIATQNSSGQKYYSYSDRTGAVIRHEDTLNDLLYDSEYDTTGRLVRQSAQDTGKAQTSDRSVYALEYGYDLNNNVTKLINITRHMKAQNAYEYDKDNLPSKHTIDGGKNITYTYDGLNQLTYEKDHEKNVQHTYAYDEGGNLDYEIITQLSPSGIGIGSETISYGYGDSSWKDKMTSYDGQSITYDAIGNPISYRDGMSMTWENGRQLKSLTQGGNTISYTYDAGGVRMSKTVNGEKWTYQYVGGKLLHETRGEKEFAYFYDANGFLSAIKYKLTPTGTEQTYYAAHNWRGDVTGLYNASGTRIASYEYDSWGKVISIKGLSGNEVTSENHIGNLNKIRYRGYYQDTETGFYYLMSRYYDPVTHRFLNADGYFQTGQGVLDKNMYMYCLNNPVNSYDPTGACSIAHSMGIQGPCPGQGMPGCLDNQYVKKDPLAEKITTPSNIIGTWIGMADVTTQIVTGSLTKSLTNAARPANIGAGSFNKAVSMQLTQVTKFSKGATKVLGAASYVGVVIDVGTGIYDNVQNNASAQKIAYDATVDLAITGGSIFAAGLVSAGVGAALGTIFPVAGNVIGAAAGFLVGIFLFVATDLWEVNGKSARSHIKSLVV